MSWNQSYPNRNDFDNRKADSARSTDKKYMGERQTEQLEVARRLAIQAMESDAFADASDFFISCSGHAADVPSVGDSLTVTVSRK